MIAATATAPTSLVAILVMTGYEAGQRIDYAAATVSRIVSPINSRARYELGFDPKLLR